MQVREWLGILAADTRGRSQVGLPHVDHDAYAWAQHARQEGMLGCMGACKGHACTGRGSGLGNAVFEAHSGLLTARMN